jgi:hypothetical protein
VQNTATPTERPTSTYTPPPTQTPSANIIAGNWIGIEGYADGHFQTKAELSIENNCAIGSMCGSIYFPELSCRGDLSLSKIEAQTFVFIEHMETKCQDPNEGFDYLRLLEDGTLLLNYRFPDGKEGASGILKRQ